MSRKSLLLTCGIVLLLAALGSLILFLLAKHEPSFYRQAELPAGELRTKWSSEFCNELANLLLENIYNERPWEPRFTQTQVNAYFAENCLTSESAPLPEGFSDARVVFEQNRVRIGFRYGTGTWSTILSANLKVWLAANQVNTLVVEVEGLYAGGLPFSSQSILERFSEIARRQEIEVTWYRLNGHPTALLKFQPGKKEPTAQLKKFNLQDGILHVAVARAESRRQTTPVSVPTPTE